MAFLREYDLKETDNPFDFRLTEYFYQDCYDRVPSVVISLSSPSKDIHCRVLKRSTTSLMIVEEIRRLYNLIEQPYWKSFVRTNSPDYRYRQDGLFDS